ncbi:MAG: winged helix DNA-binding domain-containing protein [Actinomycetota bacterium]
MARVETLTDLRLRRLRSGAQLLHRPKRMRPESVVQHLVGVQAQVLPSAALALRARTAGLTRASVDRARLEDRSIVLTWAMRGTLHLVSAADFGRLVPILVEPHVARSRRRLSQLGVTGADAERACGLIEAMLEREGPLTRAEIARRLERRRILTAGQAIAHLMWLAAAERGICFGPDRDGDRTFVLARDWIGTPERAERERALADLAVRYLRSHAPATPEDLAAWSGIRLRDARDAWGRASRRMTEVRTPAGPMWVPRAKVPAASAGVVRLLGEFDEYLLGWRDRDFAVRPSRRTAINAGGGLIRPVVLEDGRAVGTWKMARDSIEVRSFGGLSTSVRRRVAVEGEDVGAFLETRIDVRFARSGRSS